MEVWTLDGNQETEYSEKLLREETLPELYTGLILNKNVRSWSVTVGGED